MSTLINTLQIPVSNVKGPALATIPAGRVGVVKAYCEDGGLIKIDGVTVLSSQNATDTWSVLGSTNAKMGSADPGALRVTTGDTNGAAAFGTATARTRVITAHDQSYVLAAGQTVEATGAANFYIELYKIPKSRA